MNSSSAECQPACGECTNNMHVFFYFSCPFVYNQLVITNCGEDRVGRKNHPKVDADERTEQQFCSEWARIMKPCYLTTEAGSLSFLLWKHNNKLKNKTSIRKEDTRRVKYINNAKSSFLCSVLRNWNGRVISSLCLLLPTNMQSITWFG